MIQSDALYSTDDLARMKIGRVELGEARQSGLVVPRLFSGRHWYSGKEIIAFTETRKVVKSETND